MKNSIKWGVSALVLSVIFGCKKDKIEPTPTPGTDNVSLKIEHTWQNGIEFALNTDFIQPTTNDTLNFTTFKYYISNIRLKKADGSWWAQSNSYFLLDLSNGTTPSIQLTGVPNGEYTAIEYVLGVDSTRNVSGAQDGALSPSLGMFWSWNSGYIMLKAEGTSPNAGMGSFTYHLGGFSGANNIVTKRSHNFGSNSLSVTGNGNCEIHLSVAPAKLWETVGSVSTNSMIHMPGANAKTMADDFYGSFEFEHIHE
ncbi:hypothetical protein D3C71_663360 [compost metagenome]